MTLQGHVRNGMIVLDTQVHLPEGAEVTIQVNAPVAQLEGRPLMKYAGQAMDLPADASRSVDRVLYGEPSR